MCGIAGFVQPSGNASADELEAIALRMARALRHRGPDDSGSWTDAAAGVALGHRRLSVLDLSPLGHQPMHSASRRYVVVYNGEIYNHRALRAELESRGHSFRSRSDTEVLVAAVSEWGVRDALRRFNGMLAFALWDRQERTLYLARDRFGEKPLYYAWFDDALVFASELKALSAHPRFPGEIDRDALALYMRYGYVPGPHCIYRDVRKLPPGSMLKVSAAGGNRWQAPETYWSVVDVAVESVRSGFQGTTVEAIDQLDRLLANAVECRLEADVPLGAFLSGGIDSSTIVALMQQQAARPVKTFTIGFEEAQYNEAHQARAVAEHLGTDHTELYVSASDAMAVIPRLPTVYDEPFADSSQIATYLISTLARSQVTVSLSGDGGDELLGGYNRYLLASKTSKVLLGLPAPVRRAIGVALRALTPATWDRVLGALAGVAPSVGGQRHIGDKVHRLSRVLTNGGTDEAYAAFLSVWNPVPSVVLGATGQAHDAAVLPAAAAILDGTQRMMLLDAIAYLPDDILVKVDRASMSVSLETRVPFLDPAVAEFCWRLPLAMKVRDGQRKWALRQVLKKYVPSPLVDRPKTGFAVPIGAWLRGPMKEWAEDLLETGRLRAEGLLDSAQVAHAWRRHLSGGENLQERLWSVLMLESWLAEKRREPAAC